VTNAKLQALRAFFFARGAMINSDAGGNVLACGLFDSRSSEKDTREERRAGLMDIHKGKEYWRRGWESNPRIKVLQTSPLPLGYRASALQYIETAPHFQPGRLRA
jgi:hypothetical protein